ncbi:uncharacterized protein LOC113493134 [Trichoplusia ni]|uniref:Uncharacterized protein LOC113493134 n=1 Tax=Trichoplusia ni TaxID=7111 RepID=A0A7E5VEP5_TRINI|nr:uncharacterized protein LOC113493134 [Trichoplusia ni]
MVAMVASASGYGTLRRFLSVPEGQHSAAEAGIGPSNSVAVSSKQRASIKWLLSKAFNNRVPDNLQEPFYRDHEVSLNIQLFPLLNDRDVMLNYSSVQVTIESQVKSNFIGIFPQHNAI